MRNYLSFGGGVNSVALYLYLIDQSVDFEPVFMDHGTDWPETYEYLNMFQNFIAKRGWPSITVLRSGNLYDYSWEKKMVPFFKRRWCTRIFKVKPLEKYYTKPCFQMLGFDFSEINRAKISCSDGIETRYPLIEAEIDRHGCKALIKSHGLNPPMKTGCYICPFQKRSQWIELRRKHPCLFQKAVDLEQRNIDYRLSVGKRPMYLSQSYKCSLPEVVNERQKKLWIEEKYPPCVCRV